MHGRSHHRPTQDADPHGSHFEWPLLLVLSLAQLMVILDITAVNVALPELSKDLSITGDDLGWTITSYSLVFGSLLLLGGRAADRLGRRRMFLTGLGVFTLASLGSALAESAGMLFAARAGQGIGAALLSPAALSIVTTSFHGAERTKALGVWGAVGGAGAAIGVFLGGGLTELIDWRAIFFINLPIGLFLSVAARRVVAADRRPPQRHGLDLLGAAVATLSLGAIVFALSQAADAGWTSAQTLLLGGAGLLGLAAFALVEHRTRQPLLRVRALADRAVGGGFLMMVAGSAVMFGVFLLISLYLQNVLGMGALEAGLAFLPLAVAIGAGAHVGSHVIGHAGVKVPLAVGFTVAAGGALLLAGVEVDGSYAGDVLPGVLITGLGLGVVLVAVAVSVLTGAAEEESGMLSGLNTTGHEVGGSLGIAALATIATSTKAGAAGPTAAAAFANGIGDAFLVTSVIAALASLVALAVLPSAASFLPRLRLAPRVAMH